MESSNPALPEDFLASQAFSSQLKAAEAHLRREMDALGLTQDRGWTISQSFRHSDEPGIELVLRPLHLYLDPPAGLECVVRIEHAIVAEAQCSPPLRAA
jgi:hypothetical protein